MSFDLSAYGELRPFLYHLTARANLAGIRAGRRLDSAASLLIAAGMNRDVRRRRVEAMTVRVSGRDVSLRDQKPLKEGNIAFTGRTRFEDLVETLNRRVFFWAGDSRGPSGRAKSYGQRHFETYRDESPAVLRINFLSLMHANAGKTPLFCRFNSGAPRCSAAYKRTGCRVPRGPDTFQDASAFAASAAGVVEVTFLDFVELPSDTRVVSAFGEPGILL